MLLISENLIFNAVAYVFFTFYTDVNIFAQRLTRTIKDSFEINANFVSSKNKKNNKLRRFKGSCNTN